MVLGIVLLWYLWNNNLLLVKPEKVVLGLELMVLGIYALLYVFIFFCVRGKWKEKGMVMFIREIIISFMMPYHLCVKGIKTFIKDTRQEHVIHLFPYYLISLLFVSLTLGIIGRGISYISINEVNNEFFGFVIVVILIEEFFFLGKEFARFSTKAVIKSVQKVKIKNKSKNN